MLGTASAANWAVLVAGSNGFDNYRHQSDICHAYQVLVKGGVPASNIIVFAYDDIANNSANPVPGKIFNKPNGPDVYAGCVIDYKGRDVTPKNFLNVLEQNAQAMAKIGTGRVLKSTSTDKVFINFADHGAAGLIAFPNQYLYATSLTPVLTGMWNNHQYQELTFYLEACESGSMFVGFPSNQKLYAVTAANPNESSWGTYCPPDDIAGGKHIGSCLGDLFSVNWMQNSDAVNTANETLQAQYLLVQKETAAKSHVMQYGDLSFTSETVNDFIGNQHPSGSEEPEDVVSSTVSSRDNLLSYLTHRHIRLMTRETAAELAKEVSSRRRYDNIFVEVKSLLQNAGLAYSVKDKLAVTTDFDCYKDLIDTLEGSCGRTSDYGLKYFRVLYTACAREASAVQESLMAGLKSFLAEACQQSQTALF